MTALDAWIGRGRRWLAAAWVPWVWRLGGSLLVLAVLGLGTLHVVVLLAHEEETVVMTYDDPDVRTLVVDSEAGSVRVTGYSGDTIRVTARVSDGLASTQHSARVDGDQLVLAVDCPGFFTAFCSVSYLVELPRDMAANLRTDEGRITVIGLDGPLIASTDDSSIEVDAVSGPVDLRATHGSILATNLTAPTVYARSEHGRTSIGFTEPPTSVEARSTHGSVEVVVPDDDNAYRIDAGTTHGDLETLVRTDPASERSITATSTFGNVTIRY